MVSFSKFLRITFQIFAGMIILLAIIKQAEGFTGETYLDLLWGERIAWFRTEEPAAPASGVLLTPLGEKRYRRLIANAAPMTHQDPGVQRLTLFTIHGNTQSTSDLALAPASP